MILVKTPLRISFMGGGTDMEDFYSLYPGRCISATIDKSIYITISEKFEGDVRVSYSQTEMVPSCKEVKNTRAKAVMEKLGVEKGVQIVSIGDLPGEGIGLASGSAFTVGLLRGLREFKGEYASAEQIAQEACQVEIEVLKEPIGKQDQYAVSYGGINTFDFNTDGSVRVRPVYLSPKIKSDFQNHLMFFYSGKTRPTKSILEAQKANIKDKMEVLKKMSDMVYPFSDMLLIGNLRGLGVLLDEAWRLKKSLAEGISDSEIDKVYDLAKENGAWGGKILGAGGGGFLMLMVEPSKQQQVRDAIKWREVKFNFSDKGSEIVYQTI